MMERLPELPHFSTLQMPLNIVDLASEHSFVRQTLPEALEKNLGLLAMKTLADGRFFGKKQTLERIRWETDSPVIPGHITLREALYFSWSLPISVLITGAENKDLLTEKIKLARDFVKLSDEEKDLILDKSKPGPGQG